MVDPGHVPAPSSPLPDWVANLRRGLAGIGDTLYAPGVDFVRARGIEYGSLRPAGVLMAIAETDGDAGIVLTRRRRDLLRHAGQVAFPGGLSDAADISPEDTALREAEEEISLPRERVHVLGRLPGYPTVTGFLITPVVGYVAAMPLLAPEPAEVADIFLLPLARLLDSAAWVRRPVDAAGGRVTLPELEHAGYRIWGATAGMLRLLIPALRRARGG